MAFKFVKSNDAGFMEPTRMVAGDGTYAIGTALYIASGVLEVASGNVKATHISLENKVLSADGELLVYPVTPGMIFECPVEDYDATYHAVGLIAQFHTDGAQITDAAGGVEYVAATSGGAVTAAGLSHTGALIVDMRGAAADGDKVWVRLAH